MDTIQIKESELKTLMESEETSPEVIDKYFNTVFDDPFSGYLELRDNVEVIPDEPKSDEQKGVMMNMVVAVANNWAHNSRVKKYHAQIAADPDAVRLVSEGDSWFQHPHPKVLDIIDQLSNHYPIYSLGAAGDTLRNMFYEGEFVKAMHDEGPRIFLLSGGGNDILGSQFRNFLAGQFQNEEPGVDAGRFLKENFSAELKSIGNIYHTIFEKLKSQPVDVIVHGYDYVIPWDSTNKGWLGRYMLEKHIDSQVDREAIIRYMLDEFNATLQEAVSGYPNVHYIDLRNTVRNDQWYDEIHPSSDGFQDIAQKYHALIQDILNQ